MGMEELNSEDEYDAEWFGSDKDYDVNSVVDSGTDELHVIADTELEEEITAFVATVQTSYFSPQQPNSRLLQGDLSCTHNSAGKIESGWTGCWLRDFGKQTKRARSVHGISAQSQPLVDFVKCIGLGG